MDWLFSNQHVDPVCHPILIFIMVSYIAIRNSQGLCLCRHLHDEVIVPGENASFAFINPNSTSVINGKPMWNKEDIKCRMRTCATERTLFLAPMNVG